MEKNTFRDGTKKCERQYTQYAHRTLFAKFRQFRPSVLFGISETRFEVDVGAMIPPAMIRAISIHDIRNVLQMSPAIVVNESEYIIS